MFGTNVRVLCFTSLAFVLVSCGSGAPEQPSAQAEQDPMNAPLRVFSEDIQSPLKSLKMKSSEQVFVPVTIRNPTQQTWASAGKYPVTVSYKWFDNGKMLGIEGERTVLPAPIKPNDSLPVRVKIVAPATGNALVLKISLVQEAVHWFMFAGAKPLELPVTLE